MATFLLVSLIVCFSVCVQGFMQPLTSSTSRRVMRPTHLRDLVHDAAASGDYEKVVEIIMADPMIATKYDIDGRFCVNLWT
jgi:alpha-galactosidase/6-phospho-beta-glucosidase family protein